ncbi:MAG: DUF6788 family protein [Acidimicrobiales bacterium]
MANSDAERRRRQITEELSRLGFCLPGSVVARTSRCGNPNCRCHADPDRMHGPYMSWTRKVGSKTVTRNLSPAQLECYQPWFNNTRRLRELVAELEALSIQAADEAEGWGRK